MLTTSILAMLPALACASVRVYIKASSPESNGHVEYLGANVDVVEEKEIASFGLEGDRLRRAVKIYSGSLPSHAFLRSPTKIDGEISQNLYETSRFNEVTRRIIPMTGNIIKYEREWIDLKSDPAFYNPTTKQVNLTSLTETVKTTVKIDWENSSLVSQGDQVEYVIDFDENIDLEFKADFGESIEKEDTLDTVQKFEISLNSGAEVSSLRAEKVAIDAVVNYTVSLGGDVVCYFPQEYKGEKIQGFDINKVLEAANIPSTLEINQTIKIVVYSNLSSKKD